MKLAETDIDMESSHQQAERCAAQWLSRRDSGVWSETDQVALERWLDKSPVNAVAFIRLESAWARADRYKALGAGFPPRTLPTAEQLNESPFFSEAAARPTRAYFLLTAPGAAARPEVKAFIDWLQEEAKQGASAPAPVAAPAATPAGTAASPTIPSA